MTCALECRVTRVWRDEFAAFAERKTREAIAAVTPRYTTEFVSPADGMIAIGNSWSASRFDGTFYLTEPPEKRRPACSLVFVQSADGNTVAADPGSLGGGETDKHLVYEGLSRVDADAVLAGAASARSDGMVFSIWHPKLVELRCSFRKSRHPAQVVVTDGGDLPVERGLMFEEPTLPVYLITKSPVVAGLRARLRDRPWVEVVDAGNPVSLPAAMRDLRKRGIRVISAIGGRRTAAALLRDGLISDIYLTTSPIDAGEPNTPFYQGPPLNLTRILLKRGKGPEEGVRFEHFVVS